MKHRRKIKGGMLVIIGYLLSPLSWWNDIFINIPIAYFMAIAISLIHKGLFLGAFVGAYWFTNILGFVLMHKGAKHLLSKEGKPYSKKGLIQDIIVSLIYTILIISLVSYGIITSPQ